MDVTSRKSTAWALLVAGAAGIVLALATLPTVWNVVTGDARIAWASEVWLPRWAQWHVLSLAGVPLVVGALLCGMLLTSGGRPAQLLALISAVWFVGATAAFASGGYWARWMAIRGDGTPLSVQVTGHAIVLLSLSAAAVLTARRSLRRATVAHDADVSS